MAGWLGLAITACSSSAYIIPAKYDFPELTIVSQSTRFGVSYFREAYQVDPQSIILQAGSDHYLVILERPNNNPCRMNIENFSRRGSSMIFFTCRADSVPILVRRTYRFQDREQMLEFRNRILQSPE
jgi:hypothetical protein